MANIVKDFFHMITLGAFEGNDSQPTMSNAQRRYVKQAEREFYMQLGELRKSIRDLKESIDKKP